MNEQKLAPTRELGSRVVYEALKILSENGGEMRSSEVVNAVGSRVNLDDWARGVYEKSGYTRWQSILHFFSIDCVKAGFLIKRKGVWFITPEGEETLKKTTPAEFLAEATRKYWEWRKENPAEKAQPEVSTDEAVAEPSQSDDRGRDIEFDKIQAWASDGIIAAINAKGAYDFQDLAAALLRGMGYFTPFVAPKGKDGGIDIMAYRDPLGTQAPRIKVQIKHKGGAPTPVSDVRELMGLLQKDGDVGIFFSSGGFTPDAKTTARSSHVHVELIDLPRFIELWGQFYEKLSDEDKALLPLTPVYFLAPEN